MKKYEEYDDGYKGDIVRCPDGKLGTVLYFTPGHWTTHAVLEMEDGSERKELISGLFLYRKGPGNPAKH
jgi:hypothetical protein